MQSLEKYFSSILFRPGNKTSWRRHRYVSKETPNHVSVERLQDVSVVPPHDVLLAFRDGVSRGHNGSVPSARLRDVSNKSQMKHQRRLQRRLSGTSPRRLSGTYAGRPVCLYKFSCNFQMKHAIMLLWYVSTTSRSYVFATPCLSYGLYYIFRLLCYDLHLVGFHASFTHQIKDHIFLVPTKRETRGVVWIIN